MMGMMGMMGIHIDHVTRLQRKQSAHRVALLYINCVNSEKNIICLFSVHIYYKHDTLNINKTHLYNATCNQSYKRQN